MNVVENIRNDYGGPYWRYNLPTNMGVGVERESPYFISAVPVNDYGDIIPTDEGGITTRDSVGLYELMRRREQEQPRPRDNWEIVRQMLEEQRPVNNGITIQTGVEGARIFQESFENLYRNNLNT
jgi:hypothetical protein